MKSFKNEAQRKFIRMQCKPMVAFYWNMQGKSKFKIKKLLKVKKMVSFTAEQKLLCDCLNVSNL